MFTSVIASTVSRALSISIILPQGGGALYNNRTFNSAIVDASLSSKAATFGCCALYRESSRSYVESCNFRHNKAISSWRKHQGRLPLSKLIVAGCLDGSAEESGESLHGTHQLKHMFFTYSRHLRNWRRIVSWGAIFPISSRFYGGQCDLCFVFDV